MKNLWLAVEFLLFFIGVPLFILFGTTLVHPSQVILPVLVLIFFLLRFTTTFRFSELIRFEVSRQRLIRNGLIVLIISILLMVSVLVFVPENFLNLPRGNLLVWVLLSLFYPLFSAYGQEIIFRTFLFHRYQKLFPNQNLMILVSGVTFSFAHIVYFSWISVALTLLAGLYFAYEYSRTRSVLFTSILHGILGDVVFAIGLGEYFWKDIAKFLP